MSASTTLPPTPLDLPLLPLRDVVVFPHMVIPLFVGRPKSIKALESAMESERRIMLVAQKTAAKDEPVVEDMFEVGCMATILQLLKLPDGTVKVLVEGQQRAKVNKIEDGEQHFSANVTPIEPVDIAADKTSEIEALRRAVMQQFDNYVKLNKKIPPEILTSISSIDDPGRLADTIAAHLPLKLDAKQVILDLSPIKERLENLYEQLEREVDILNVDKKIRGRVKRQMEKNQRDFYLNEQVKAIQKELGDGEDGADVDEIDKLGTDFRGDPSSALLEVLDPEQNHTFGDHYVEVDFDLSDVMFVATSNSMNIPPALLDRMEVIRLSGYTEDEKTSIAMRYLLPKQVKNNGVKPEELEVQEQAVRDIVRYYTREAGVRSLERELGKICRKVIKGVQLKKMTAQVVVTPDNLNEFLGVRKFDYGRAEKINQIGQVVGLAWTEVGGDLLTIEAAIMPGKGLITRTGSLGDVMKESVDAARTVVRSRSAMLGIKDELFEKRDIHIHVPDGATPKDGPSAGAAMTTAFISALTGIPVRGDVAMTGEITLRGEVTAIGGLKEKLLAALRGGIKTVLIPEENAKDLQEIPDNVKNGLEIIPVKWIDQVLKVALERMPVPLTDEEIALPAVAAVAAIVVPLVGATDPVKH